MERICQNCKEKFQNKRNGNILYCSKTCKQKAYLNRFQYQNTLSLKDLQNKDLNNTNIILIQMILETQFEKCNYINSSVLDILEELSTHSLNNFITYTEFLQIKKEVDNLMETVEFNSISSYYPYIELIKKLKNSLLQIDESNFENNSMKFKLKSNYENEFSNCMLVLNTFKYSPSSNL